MELVILGSGTYQPELKRHTAGYLIKLEDQALVFDFGRGTLDQLLKLGLKYADVDAVFISHLHADHASELSSFLHISLAEPAGAKLRKKAVVIYGPLGIKKTLRLLLKVWGLDVFNPPHAVKIKELRDGSLVKGTNWEIKSFKVKHDPQKLCLAYRLEAEGKIIAYSGDTADSAGLRQAGRQADLAVIEATWPKESASHLTAEKAGKIAQAAGVKKLVLTHIAPDTLENHDVRQEAKKFFKGPVLLAKDLMKIKI